MRWTIAESWAAASDVVALVYGVPVEGVRAASRGRGPRPPLALRGPRKVAVWLGVQVCGADYAAFGRAIGLHKDTVASHVGEVGRQDVIEELGMATAMLLHVTRARLLIGQRRSGALVAPHPRAVLIDEARRLMCALEAEVLRLSDEDAFMPTSSDASEIVVRQADAPLGRAA